MEAPDRALLDQWMASWSDLVDFEVHRVITSKEAAEKVSPCYEHAAVCSALLSDRQSKLRPPYCRTASSKLREAVADGPILLRGVENVHEHVLRPDAGAFAEQLRGPPEQRFLLFHGAGVEHVIWMYTRSSLRATPKAAP